MDELLNKKILIVDDEPELLQMIEDILFSEGFFNICTAPDCAKALSLARAQTMALFVLDVNLPDGNGFMLYNELRKISQAPVIFLTARGEPEDRIRGLGLGADDYIVKPFEIEELLARVEAVLRRTGRGGQTLTAFDVTMDIVARTVTRQGKAVELTPREFDLLEQLMRNRGAALYRDVLYGRVWGGDLLDSRTLDLHIQRLRKKLGWADKIETVYRVGYRLKSDQK